MKTRCKCGIKLTENYYQINDKIYCSECYKEEKFSRSISGYLLITFFFILLTGIGILSIMIPFFSLVMSFFSLVMSLLFGWFKHGPSPIFFPHIINTFLLLILGIFLSPQDINSKKIRIIPSQLIKKMFSIKCFQYLIIYLYHLYVHSFFAIMLMFNDGVENTEIFGFHFNVTIANLLLYASLISLISIQIRIHNSNIEKKNKKLEK